MAEPDPAKRQLILMTLVRLAGVLLAVMGLWVAAEQPVGDASLVPAIALLLSGGATVIFAARLFRK